ncbi:uncharacterized protein THITE_116310 [Thermothielavioides terrestris NRRL 8126]|uniref:Uncharacterized protein n=1 Tax=Thermothielavioides terrestris (strain ATCC 38088 / NRRL 8126) TaxID=578455 RepID=G2QWK5_THETT|nr:uncharacterized protein THITE_116310 [Thermothielavioides terrestris NRRL 8126]AEO64780.1 hypothetical protein THITE_116310 [Thermothielavioides terrestris NRRL 8126]
MALQLRRWGLSPFPRAFARGLITPLGIVIIRLSLTQQQAEQHLEDSKTTRLSGICGPMMNRGGNMAWQPPGQASKPMWCYFWPAACPTSSTHGKPTPTTKRQTSPSPERTTNTPKTTPAPATTPPAATPPATTPPAATQPPKTSPHPAPAPSPTPSPTTQPKPAGTSSEKPDAQSTSVNHGQSGDSGAGNAGLGTSPTLSRGPAESGTGAPSASEPTTASTAPTIGGVGGTGATSVGSGASVAQNGGASGGGLPPGAIAGIVVGLLLFLALLGLLLYRLRRTAAVQRLLGPFGSKLGGGSGAFQRMDTPGPDGMGSSLLSPSPEATAAMGAAAAAGAGGAAAAAAATARNGTGPRSQTPMAQTGYLQPLAIPPNVARRDSNRVSIITTGSAASSGAFTPSPVSPLTPTSMLSPGAVRTSRPVQEPPDPRAAAATAASATHAHVSAGSISSISTGSAISAALAPGQMAWPMPPATPPVLRRPDGSQSQYLDFEQSGQTVVRINQPPRSGRSGGY